MSTSTATACPTCDAPVAASDRFCEACGTALVVQAAAAAMATPDDGRVETGGPDACGVTHRGLRHRRNEDAMHVAVAETATVAVVCDGVSASSDPHVAARAAAGAAGAALASTSDDLEAQVAHAIAAAQSAVEQTPWDGRPHPGPPACTIVAAVWDGSRLVVGNVGDSRAYWISDDDALCLTEDDSVARELAALGASASEIVQSGNQHAIVRWLGSDAPDDQPYRVSTLVPPAPGRVVVCSDGLWNYADAAVDVAALVRATPLATARDVAHALVDFALRSGGDDNVTVAVFDLDPSAYAPNSPEEHS